ncbi:hypothetical protein BSAE_1868 [Bifidobacterium pullorum subsp. saeculare DSM 6531 = LMG 14934]|uniref:Uncharacterized protein n=1 Tax=Bifidobacterium pullorum subsp. saeculare DSM 6531 = LMG 14934 TaxID=1437611 RepID=A0A087CPG6_9BIFI|nr:hypothetical protein BSAE_1868 [Bifidobacterium pullorum subsp. saeculare DSM 6531 = LMG 14934]
MKCMQMDYVRRNIFKKMRVCNYILACRRYKCFRVSNLLIQYDR